MRRLTFGDAARMMDPMRLRTATASIVLMTLAAATGSCTSPGGGDRTGGGASRLGMVAIVATPDLAAGDRERVSVGLPLGDERNVSFGTVELSFSYLGTAEEPATPSPSGVRYEARYVPTPGTPDAPEDGSGPRVTSPSQARGIYEADGVRFERAGFWRVEVTAELEDEGTQRASTAFEVLERHALPAPGDRALPTRNRTLADRRVPPEAIDSRAEVEGHVPDPELHRWTIAEALRRRLPIVAIFSTPVYCVSRFCGPVTEVVEDLASRYDDRAVFIHVEIWRDFAAQPQVVNEAAAEWLYRDGDLTEPWLFTIAADGTIVDRWASVFDPADVAGWLEDLATMPERRSTVAG